MKKLLFLIVMTPLVFIGCDKLDEKLEEGLQEFQKSFITGDFTIDGSTMHEEPSLVTPTKIAGKWNILAPASLTPAQNAINILGNFSDTGRYVFPAVDMFMAYNNGTLYNTDYKGANNENPELIVRVTSIESKKIKGTFTATLYSNESDGQKACIVENGTFDIDTSH